MVLYAIHIDNCSLHGHFPRLLNLGYKDLGISFEQFLGYTFLKNEPDWFQSESNPHFLSFWSISHSSPISQASQPYFALEDESSQDPLISDPDLPQDLK